MDLPDAWPVDDELELAFACPPLEIASSSRKVARLDCPVSALSRNRIALNLAGSFQEVGICTLVTGTCRSTANETDRVKIHLVGAFVTDCMDPLPTARIIARS